MFIYALGRDGAISALRQRAARLSQFGGIIARNGAGKTTLRILTTLLPADAGEAFAAGADVRRSPQLVRRRIGYAGQLGGAGTSATGRRASCSRGGCTG